MAASYAEGDLCAAEGAGPTSSREEAIGRGQWVGDRRGFTRIPSRDGVASIPLFSDNGFTPHPSDSFGTESNPMGLPGLGYRFCPFGSSVLPVATPSKIPSPSGSRKIWW